MLSNMIESLLAAKGPEKERMDSPESVDALLEEMLRESEEVGHGQDGVILKIDLSVISAEHRNILAQNGILSPVEVNEVAVKVLKIYHPGKGDQEYRTQKKAREALAGASNAARVPDTTVARDQHLDKDTRDRLKSYGAQLEDKAEIIVMDYIDGKNLGALLYEFVLQKIGYTPDQLASLSYSQKEQLVAQELKFEVPNLAVAENAQEVRAALGLTDDRNDEKLFRYLKRQGMRLDPAIFEKVDNAIRILHQNGIHHNDLHKGNVMIDSKGEVYIIDFGRSHEEKRDGDIPDTKLSEKWRKLSVSDEEEQEQIYAHELAQLKDVEKRMRASPDQQKRIDSFIDNVIKKGTPALESELALSRASDARLEQFFIMLHLAYQKEGVDKDMLAGFVKSLESKERRFRPFENNKIKLLQKIGYLN